METILESYLIDFVKKFNFEKEEQSLQFEYFCNYISISKTEENRECIEKISIGKDGNPGIDGLAIIVNDHVVTTKEEVDFFLENLGRLEVEFYFVQAKTSSSFSMAEIVAYINCVKDFFTDNPRMNFNEETLRLHEVKEYIYTKSLKMMSNPRLNIIYACAGKWGNPENINASVSISLRELNSNGYFSDVQFTPCDCNVLKSTYRELQNSISRTILFERHTIIPQINDVEEAYLGMLPIVEYLKLICNDRDELLRNIFYDNVRDFQGFNSVNTEIKNTIENESDRDKFALLNNGVTIVAKNIRKIGANFTISDYQIVNGCQTSHVLYYNRNCVDKSMYIPVKIIVTKEYDLMSKIIRANNRQTTVGNEAFEILSSFHKGLEEYYQAMEKKTGIVLYYERRNNQFEQQNLSRTNYITLSNQIKSVVAMFFNEPQNSMQKYFGELLQDYKAKIFQEDDKYFPYYISGLCTNKIEGLFISHLLDKRYKRFKYHIAMLIRISITGTKVHPFNSSAIEKDCEKTLTVLRDENAFRSELQKAVDKIDKALQNYNRGTRNAHGSSEFTKLLLPNYIESKTEGKINYYNSNRGFGYIDVGTSEDIFFHIFQYHNSIDGDPQVGDLLYFDIVDSEKGLRAVNITK